MRLHLELLEPRRLLSAGHAAALPLNIVYTYTGMSIVAFSPGKGHPPASDPLTLSVTSESSQGVVEGTFSDHFGLRTSITGRLSGRLLRLRLTSDPAGGGISGTLVAHASPDGHALIGTFRETDGSVTPPLHFHGPILLHTLTVGGPAIDVGVSHSALVPGALRPGRRATVVLTLQHVPADAAVDGIATITVTASPFASGVGPTRLANLTERLTLRPDRSRTLRVSFRVPRLEPDQYYVVTDVEYPGDTNAINNQSSTMAVVMG